MCLAIPGKVLTAYEKSGLPMARVQFGAVPREACLAYAPEAVVGDYVLVHLGFAISRINEEEAQRTYQALLTLGHGQRRLRLRRRTHRGRVNPPHH